ncbi:MAG: hypothetical protein LBT83_05925, partial [Tannerella sp.]|nr:hypothetical protein [Tannerella sp.]
PPIATLHWGLFTLRPPVFSRHTKLSLISPPVIGRYEAVANTTDKLGALRKGIKPHTPKNIGSHLITLNS